MERFPVIGRHHLDCIPGTTIEEGAVWSFADALLTTDAKIRVNLNSSKGRMILIRHPEHACFNWTILDASR